MKRALRTFIRPPGLGKTTFYKLLKLFCVVFILFTVACTSNKSKINTCLTSDEIDDLRYFLNFLMFENQGAFVVFGSKPLCEISICDPDSKAAEEAFQKKFASLSDSEKAKIEEIKRKARPISQTDLELERHCYKGWLAFNKAMLKFKMKNYILRTVPLWRPDAYGIFLINIRQTKRILAENYKIFREAVGIDFNPNQVVLQADDPNSVFWNNVFAMDNHVAKGLLFGYGLQNSEEASVVRNATIHFSTDAVVYGQGSLNNFTIPLFGMVPGDKTADQYRKEKVFIQKIYRNKDMVEVTLQSLTTENSPFVKPF